MAENKKIFTKSKFKLGLVTMAALVALSASPKKAQAQEVKKDRIEKFDLNNASQGEKEVYSAMVKVFEVKFDKDFSQKLAAKILIDSKKFEGEAAGNFIQISVGIVMKEYKNELDAARQSVGLPKAIVTQTRIEKVSGAASMKQEDKNIASAEVNADNQNTVIPVEAIATAKRKMEADSAVVVNNETVKIVKDAEEIKTVTASEKIIKSGNFNEEQRAEFEVIFAKIKVANHLKNRSNNLDRQTATQIFAMPEESRAKALEAFTKGIMFRDGEDASFVAYNPKTGIGKIHAPKSKMKSIERDIRKAGGLSAYVEAGQQKKVRKTENAQTPVDVIDFGRN